MGTITIELNEKEEEILKKLMGIYDVPTSAILKKAMFEMYEEILDRQLIDKIEEERKTGEDKWHTAEDILKDVE